VKSVSLLFWTVPKIWCVENVQFLAHHVDVIVFNTKGNIFVFIFHLSCLTKSTSNRELARVKKVAHTRLPSVGFQSRSRFLAVSLQVTWIINPTVGCHYFPPGLLLPPPATNFAAWWTEAQWVWTVCLGLLPDSVATAIWTRALLRLSPARLKVR